ncbi:MAG TPA: hypothetical protein VFJ70_04250 [Burkholderiales bacterium]|nr:hypothetical protein [Burkholderiales bacterium]
MNPTAIYSKSGKGVQEASGKTSLLQRADRAVLAAIDGRATLADVAQKVGKPYDAGFQKIIAQLDKDGFIRQVTAGAPAAGPAKPAAAAPVSRPVSKPLAKPESSLGDLDFSSLGGASKPASRPAAPSQSAMEQTTILAKAREEAEAKAAAERDKLKKEAEAKARAEMEAQARTEAQNKIKEEAAARAKAEADAKARAAQEAAARAAAEAKAKAEAEARARIEAEAKAKLEAERKAREELERKLEAERKAREEAERKAKAEAERRAKEEAERARKEAEEKARREAEELRQRLEAERKAREEAERKAKQEAERARKEAEEKARLEAERQREEARRREEEERKQREAEEAAQREAAAAAAAAAAAMANVEAAPGPGDGVSKKAKKKDSFADSLLADLESFTSDSEEEQKAKEEADQQVKAEADRRRAELDRRASEEAERRRQAEEEEQRLAEEARRAQAEEQRRAQEEERRAQQEERRRREAEEIRRKAEAATAAAMAKEGKKHEPKEEDIPVSDDDLDMTEVEREEAEIAEARAKEKEEKERAAKKEKKKKKEEEVAYAPAPSRPRRPIKWGKPVSLTLALLLIIGVGAAHIVPLDTAGYERISSEALGRTVKIESANLWLFSGLPQVRFSNVRVGNARIARVVASGWPGGLFSDKKEFTNVRVEGLSLPQEAIGDALFAKLRADNLSISTLTVKNLQLPGPATLPKDLLAEATFDARGTLRSAKVEGPDGLVAKLTPKEDGSINFEAFAGGFTLPIAPQVTLSKFAMHGVATPRGMTINDWGGAIFQGGISGKASVHWSGSWNVEGVVTVRNINAAVFAPALLSSGNADGTAKFSMSAPDAAGLVAGSRLDGTFTVNQGTLGSFDLARYIQSGGRQAAGVTQFAEMNGQASYDRGSVALRNVNIGAGRLNAGASADIASNGALSGRIVVDLKVSDDTRRATLLIGGTVKEPQLRN